MSADKVKFENKMLFGDCLELMKDIPDKSIDMILCDLPYGTTACKWDVIIPFEPLWEQYKRIVKNNTAIVLFGNQPFTTDLINSNRKWFKYEIIWKKEKPTNPFTIKKQFGKIHENILIFYKKTPVYNPNMVERKNVTNPKPMKGNLNIDSTNIISGVYKHSMTYNPNFIYPTSILEINRDSKKGNASLHPTQKPVALFEYLIKTYSNEGDLVLDNCAGSGTTAIACLNTNRQFIVMEKEKEYFDIIKKRVADYIPNIKKEDNSFF